MPPARPAHHSGRMRIRARYALPLAAVLFVTAAAVPSAAVAPRTSEREGQARLQRDVDALYATGATGVLAEVSGSGRPMVARAGVADPVTGQPIAGNTRHRIESTTKTFVATVVLQLAGEGLLGLDDSVERWLPGLVTGNGHDGTTITVRQLLGHTSGLPDYAERLLKPVQLREMQTTRLAEPFAAVWDEPGYGLGLMRRRLPCGGWAWFHGGGWWNAITDNAVTADGRRSVTVFLAGTLEPGQDPTDQAKASARLIDNALCAA
jgi:CubicO group peptidase (beta-lactamase class C family)